MGERSFLGRLFDDLSWHYATKRTRLLYGWRVAELGYGAVIERGARINNPRSLRLGSKVRINRGARISICGRDGEYISIGDSACIAGDAWLDSAGGHIEIGSDVYVGPYTYIGGHGGCKVGDDCQIAGFCYIIAANHEFDDRDTPIRLQGYTLKGIAIGADCWVGNGVTVLDGVTVGRGSVLAARAVVTKDVPEYAVVGGIPARVLRMRGEPRGDGPEESNAG